MFETAGCGTCHTFAAANSKGAIGPNLDQLHPAFSAVVRQVLSGGGGMPSFQGKLKPADIRAVASFVSERANGSGQAFLEFHPDKTVVAQCHDEFLCLRQAFGNLAYYDDPVVALARLDSLSRTDSTIANLCHPIAHSIGHAAYAKYRGNAAAALVHGSMTCGSGYYHGVIERAFGGIPRSEVPQVADELCRSLHRGATFLLWQCVHGLGHGLMIYSSNDLPYSLKVCHGLSTVPEQQTCAGGVFMQNFLPGAMAIAPTKWVRRDDLIFPCNKVAQIDKLYCYLIVTSRILPQVHYDWKLASRWCLRAETGWVSTCFQSLGRDASGFTSESAQGIAGICAVAGSMEKECIYGAVRDVTQNDAGARRSPRLCAIARVEIRGYCYSGIGTILGTLIADRPARRRACDRAVPSTYRHDCYVGAGT